MQKLMARSAEHPNIFRDILPAVPDLADMVNL
jgi:hypothetical protein